MVMGRMIAAAMLLMYCVVVSGHYEGNPFVVRGRVYCDTCRAGFETDATTDIPGAMVRIECKDREGQQLKYSIEGVTNSNGTYNIMVIGDRGDDICDVVSISSPQSDCAESDLRHNCARVILTNNNGVISNNRFANSLGFLRNEPMPVCTELLQKYKETDDDA